MMTDEEITRLADRVAERLEIPWPNEQPPYGWEWVIEPALFHGSEGPYGQTVVKIMTPGSIRKTKT